MNLAAWASLTRPLWLSALVAMPTRKSGIRTKTNGECRFVLASARMSNSVICLSYVDVAGLQVALDKDMGKVLVAFSNPLVSLTSAQPVCEQRLKGKVHLVVSYERINRLAQILPTGVQDVYAGLMDNDMDSFFSTPDGTSNFCIAGL
jgi:hypothetical protein